MSHFTVAVFTAAQPDSEQLAAILQPWHDYDWTDIEDQYVVDVDETDLLRAEFEKDGEEGESFEDFVERSSAAELREDGRWYRRTNPNGKWDWWAFGGRWSGSLKLKKGATGILGDQTLRSHPPEPGTADQARVSDVDFDGMAASGAPLQTFAYVKDGEWVERGRIDTWANVYDEKDESAWDDEFNTLLAQNGDAWITIVDCHY